MKAVRALLAGVAIALAGCGASEPNGLGVSLATEVSRAPWQTKQSVGEVLTTRHYRIYTTANRQVVLRCLPGFMEAAHEDYLHLTGLADRTPKEPLPIYMMGTRAEWALLTESISGSSRNILLSIEAGGYFHRDVCVFWDIGGANTFSVAAHEGLHQFLNYRLKDRLPMWLEEGLCVSAEGHQIAGEHVRFTPDRNPFRVSSLRTAIIQRYWLGVPELLPMDAGDVVTQGAERAVSYYAQLWALVVFLRSQPTYREGLTRLIADAEAGRFADALGAGQGDLGLLRAEGRTYNRRVSEPLFRHYITDDVQGFDVAYRGFARKFAGLD